MENNLVVTKFILREMSGYQDMYHRGYAVNALDDGLQAAITNSYDGNRIVDQNLFSATANRLLTPSSTPDSMVSISNGWNERRYLFVLTLESGFQGSNTIIETTYVGYTENYDVVSPFSMALNDDQRLYVNSIIQVRKTKIKDPYSTGYRETSSLVGYDYIFANGSRSHMFGGTQLSPIMPIGGFNAPGSYYNPLGMPPAVDLHALTPENVLRYDDVSRSMRNYLPDDVNDPVMGYSTINKVQLARRQNAIPKVYMSTLLEAVNAASAMTESTAKLTGMNISEDPLAAHSPSSYCNESSPMQNALMQNLSRYCDILSTGAFSIRDLKALAPRLEELAQVFNSGGVTNQSMPLHYGHEMAGTDGANWNDSTLETTTIYRLSQGIPSLMSMALISSIHFRVTNEVTTQMGSGWAWDIDGDNLSFISTLNPQEQLNAVNFFKSQLEVILLNPITSNRAMAMNLVCDISIVGNAYFLISINGGVATPYVNPVFADSLLSSMVISNEDTFGRISTDIKGVVDFARSPISTAAAMNQYQFETYEDMY